MLICSLQPKASFITYLRHDRSDYKSTILDASISIQDLKNHALWEIEKKKHS